MQYSMHLPLYKNLTFTVHRLGTKNYKSIIKHGYVHTNLFLKKKKIRVRSENKMH